MSKPRPLSDAELDEEPARRRWRAAWLRLIDKVEAVERRCGELETEVVRLMRERDIAIEHGRSAVLLATAREAEIARLVAPSSPVDNKTDLLEAVSLIVEVVGRIETAEYG